MEIHHHPKYSEKPRKVTEYLFEFLVIFVAITGSFFAENLRESNVDRHKVKEYMKSLVLDLKADTTKLGVALALNAHQRKGLDSLLMVMESPLVGINLARFYDLSQNYTANFYGFNPVTTTMMQLMNTGSLRLVKYKAVSDGIVNYDNTRNAMVRIGDMIAGQITKNFDEQAEIIDFIKLRKLSSGTFKQNEYPALLTTDNKAISKYYFRVRNFTSFTILYTFELTDLKKQASSLIQLIQEEYSIE